MTCRSRFGHSVWKNPDFATDRATDSGARSSLGLSCGEIPVFVIRLLFTRDGVHIQFPEYRLKKQLVLYFSPVLLLLGTLGNLFSFIVLRRKPLVKVSSYIYLASLALIDTVVLYIGLLRVWLAELTGVDFQDSGDWICKLSVVLGYVASDLSVWLIIAVTVERYIVVCFPFKASAMCNTNRAKKVIAFLTCLMLAINFHFFWTSGIWK
ncbi:FMRFamide receptor-like, partial [Elysia marginata]